MTWADGRLIGFDLETTGKDPDAVIDGDWPVRPCR